MHLSAWRPCPTVSSKSGMRRVRSRSGAAHFGDDAGGFAGLQFVETARVLAVFVAKGQVVEQVLGGLNVFGGEHLGDTAGRRRART